MKKIMSLILSSIILLSSFALLPTTAFAKTTKPKETTYIASCGVYKNSFGKVFASKDKLVFQDKKGKKTVLDKASDNFYDKWYRKYTFYIRGKTVYYTKGTWENNFGDGAYSVRIDGTNRKKIGDATFSLLGGYGSAMIFVNRKEVFSCDQGKTTKLFNTNNYPAWIFNGKIYCGKKVYNIDTKKTGIYNIRDYKLDYKTDNNFDSRLEKEKNLVVTTKSYMYFINNNGRLIRLDKAGNKKTVDKGIIKVLGANNNGNVVYVKKNSKGEESLYRCTSKGNIVMLTTYKSILKKIQKTNKAQNENLEKKVYVEEAVLVGGKVLFIGNQRLFSVDNKGGNLKYVIKNVDYDFFIKSLEACDGRVYYSYVGNGDQESYEVRVKSV